MADETDLITLTDPRSPAAEAYRTLRTNVQFSSLDRPIRSLLITSANQNEGKSTTAANLAVTFAQSGSQVVLIDADLRRPGLHQLFDVSNDRGLTTMLLEDEGVPPFAATAVEGLRLLPSGPQPPNPSEMLGSQRLVRALERIEAMADLLVLDAPPVLLVSDATVLARRVDAALLVLSAGQTKRDHASRARQQLDRAGVNVLGVVLTNARVDTSSYSDYA